MNWEALCRMADQMILQRCLTTTPNPIGGRTMTQTTVSHSLNGVNLDRLASTVEAIQQQPALATFQFRSSNAWIDGGHNRSTIKGFYGAGQEDTERTKPFVLDAAEPPVLLGKDQGPNPVEYVLHALAACLTTSMVYHAAARGIRIESVESRLEGDLDLRGFLGLSQDVRKGYQGIRVHFTITSDADPKQLEQLTTFSPVHDIIANPVPVSISVTTAKPTQA